MCRPRFVRSSTTPWAARALITAQLPDSWPVPRLLATVDDGDWVILVLEEIDGRMPDQPWTLADLAATFEAMRRLAALGTPCPITGLPTFADRHDEAFWQFRRLAGAPWLDALCLLPSVQLGGGPSPAEVEAALDPLAGAEPDAVNAALAALTGYFTVHGLEPDPPGLPTVRAFQRAQGDVSRAWLAQRVGL